MRAFLRTHTLPSPTRSELINIHRKFAMRDAELDAKLAQLDKQIAQRGEKIKELQRETAQTTAFVNRFYRGVFIPGPAGSLSSGVSVSKHGISALAWSDVETLAHQKSDSPRCCLCA